MPVVFVCFCFVILRLGIFLVFLRRRLLMV